MSLAEDLYEQDFYAWTRQQSDLLKRRTAGLNALDWDNLAEEVESLGNEQLHACESLLRQIVTHFLKIVRADEGERAALPHRSAEISNFRLQIEDRLTPTLRHKLEERAPVVIDRILKAWSPIDRELVKAVREAPPTLEQCLDETWLPEPGSRSLKQESAAPES